ncbi:MAG TPA: amidohydrolase family protein [Chitinophagaceae bacterium]|nr:amidohydrolase family protein [Chitinophagaceae bacterium]
MKKIISLFPLLLIVVLRLAAQDDVYPARDYDGLTFITHATVHVGNGTVLEGVTIRINHGKIEQVGPDMPVPSGEVRVIDAAGKQVYPGLILPQSDLGLKEIANAVRGSDDYQELGEWNTDVRAITAYNTDSKIINTLKANGILLANVAPAGSLLAGSSTVVQLDAWNWEDATYRADVAMQLEMPSLLPRRSRFGGRGAGNQPESDPQKEALAKIEAIRSFLREARSYLNETSHAQTNLKFEALRPLFSRQQKLFVHCDQVKQMLLAIDFAKEFQVDVVIVGGSESWQIADLLKQNNIPVILGREHALPTMQDDDIDQPFKTPYLLQKAGVLFALNDDFEETRYRNLAFNAGTAAAYGLTREQALQAITLNAARILGIDDRTGTIEAGKDANLVISEGDILDMRTSIITDAFIQGRRVSLENKQTQLYQRYKHKYGLK